MDKTVVDELNQENMNEFDLDIFMAIAKSEVTEKDHIQNPYLNT